MKTKQLLISLYAMLMATAAWADVEINETNFPDENFRNWVLNQEYGKDGMLVDAEIANVSRISVRGKGIRTLKGIEYFTALTRLWCDNNQLTTLDVSQNTALIEMNCGYNQLTTLDVSHNTALIEMNCANNQLIALDVSGCTALTYLKCSSNQLTALDVSGCTALTYLICYDNQLAALDVSGCTALTSLECYQNQIKGEAMDVLVESLPTVTNKKLKVVVIDDDENVMTVTQVAAAEIKGWYPQCYACGTWQAYPGIGSDETDVAINVLSFPDATFRSWVLNTWYGKDGKLTDEEIASVTLIDVNGKSIRSLKGIEYFSALKELRCYDNQLTELDMSNNPALTKLLCYNNQLTELNLSSNTELEGMNCSNNRLPALDLSACTVLRYIYCVDNQLTDFNISACTELKLIMCNSNKLTSLDISNNTALEELWCSSNQLTALDLSNNLMLKKLLCFDNKIKGAAMDELVESLPRVVEGNFYVINDKNEQNVMTYEQADKANAKGWQTWKINMEGILINFYGDSAGIGVSGSRYSGCSPNAIDIGINETNFPDMYFRNNLLKQEFGVDSLLSATESSMITSLDVSGKGIQSLKGIEYFTALRELSCNNNQLTELDMSNNPELYKLDCSNNQLMALDMSNNPQIKELSCYLNRIYDSEMEVLVESLPTVNDRKMYVFYNSYREQNEMSTIRVAAAKDKGWQPYYFWSTWMPYDGCDPVGIKDIDHSPLTNDLYYNLAGQRLQKMQKGINIVNGKKVLVK